MSRYAALDLSRYPVADILDPIDYESLLADIKADFSARWEALRATRDGLPSIDTLDIESEPLAIVLQAFAYREMLLRARVNDAVRQLSLASASGAALDHIGATYFKRTVRIEGEDDGTYRARLAVAPESWSSAGPEGAYVFFGYGASDDIRDLAILSVDEGVAMPGEIIAAVLSVSNGGVANAALLAAVTAALRKSDRMPAGDFISVLPVTTLPYAIAVDLKIAPGVAHEPIRAAARQRLTNWANGLRRFAGEGEEGPVWLIGRTINPGEVMGRAIGEDPNIVTAAVTSPAAPVNAPSGAYKSALAAFLAAATEPATVALASSLTQHLFRAPICTGVTVTSSTFEGDL